VKFGDCRTVESTVRDLARIGYSRSVSSIRPATGGGGEGETDQPVDAARQACTNELSRHGWPVARPAPASRSGQLVVFEQQVRGSVRSQQSIAQCTYDPRMRTVQIRV